MKPTGSRQVVQFHPKHYSAMMLGTKTTTVRWNEGIRPGPALFVFGTHPTAATVTGRVIAVESYPLAELSPTATRQPPETDMNKFANELRANYYPEMPTNALIEVVVLAVDTPPREGRN